ncbi:MAG: alpha/beta fold hydrolase [Lysobacterales bacterium]
MPTVNVNNHDMYYEIIGEGDPAICMGGWGTYCHGNEGNLAKGLTDKFQTLLIDYRGVGDSTDDLSQPATMKMHAQDVMELLDHLGWTNVHFIGLVGMGACVAQEVAIQRPELVRSMVNMGCWAAVDDMLKDQLELFRDVHRDMGFEAFQKLVCCYSFRNDFYNKNRSRLLAPSGPWSELVGRQTTHARLVDACISHDVRDQLDQITAPTLLVHSGMDVITTPKYTREIESLIPTATGVDMPEVAHVVAGKEQKIAFCDILFSFLDKH